MRKTCKIKRGNFFSSCNVFVFPVTYRNGWVDVWGLIANESIQHGKPVVATKAVGSVYKLIFEGQNGFVVGTRRYTGFSICNRKSEQG